MFIGRKGEISILKEPNWREKAQLMVVHGRRRVGKTALIEHAFANERIWKFEGIEGGDLKVQIALFLQQLTQYQQQDGQRSPEYVLKDFPSWLEVFQALDQALRPYHDKSLVIFIDEFQWLAEMNQHFVGLFKVLWDNQLSPYSKLKVILCGSVSSFMVKHVMHSKALYGRVSTELHLSPLPLNEIGEFFDAARHPQEIIDIAMTLGGIPKYLEELNPSLSLIQNLNEYALKPSGFFFREIERVFISHFGKNPHYRTIVEALSKESSTVLELAKKCKTQRGGTFSDTLKDLELAGFIERYIPLDKSSKSRSVRYRLLDEYLHLYFALIEPYRNEIIEGTVTGAQLSASPKYKQWLGFAFERLCRRNAALIADHLRFSGIRYRSGSWFSTKRQASKGAQIDLLFDRADNMLTVCEAKHSSRLQAQSIIKAMDTKIMALEEAFPQKGIEKVLLLAHDARIPDALKRYFDKIIMAGELLHAR